jgi:hypothetical protein
VLTVGKDVSQVERRLSAGLLACPDCGGRLGPWGHARARVLRAADGSGWRCQPRRTRCGTCRGTHVLLPVSVLVRRVDVVEVIGAGLGFAAAGWGYRRIAQRLGRPECTVRGWLRRLRAGAEGLRSAFTDLLVGLDPLALLPEPVGTAVGDVVAVIVAAAVATVRRWGGAVSGLSSWELAAAVTSGRLLTSGLPTKLINTSCPW